MTLKEKLDALEITAEDQNIINSLVDTLIVKKTSKIQGDLDQANKTIAEKDLAAKKEVLDKRNEAINKFVSGETDEDKIEDALKLAGLSDEDSLEEAQEKIKTTIKSRKWLQKSSQEQKPPAPVGGNKEVPQAIGLFGDVKEEPKVEPKGEPLGLFE